MTRIGFYSIVFKQGSFQVRARVRQDLVNLNREAKLGAKIIESPNNDYRYRILLPGDKLPQLFLALAASVTYENFKSEIAATPDQKSKLDAYHSIWGIMERLQPRPERVWHQERLAEPWPPFKEPKESGDRYVVQSEQVRGEPMLYYVMDLTTGKCVSEEWKPNKRTVENECRRMNQVDAVR